MQLTGCCESQKQMQRAVWLLEGYRVWFEKCLQRGTDWGFIYSGLRLVFRGLNERRAARKVSWYFCMVLYTVCPRRNVPDFGRLFLMLKYTDINQNTYVQSWTVTEIMAREKCGILAVPRTAPVQLTRYVYTAHVLETEMPVNIVPALRTFS